MKARWKKQNINLRKVQKQIQNNAVQVTRTHHTYTHKANLGKVTNTHVTVI